MGRHHVVNHREPLAPLDSPSLIDDVHLDIGALKAHQLIESGKTIGKNGSL
ncbi:hypothetical protein [Ensifer adhaerens]|jgi:hypothetical protein|uniref:hypothetical protein n=1 Tax=Ensifer adhaerens TaxID=106592 RepID=UPI00202E1897|nr:hypothetical protein [Ensifer adhaerens]